MKTPFDMTLPIETLYDQIENAVELANVGLTPYSAPQVVAVAYLLVVLTGQLDEACRDWKRTLIGHVPQANFKFYFGLTLKEPGEFQQTAQGIGFVPQNTNNATVVKEYAAETTEAIENLANTVVQNQSTVQHLTATNTSIKQYLMEANQKLTAVFETIASLLASGGDQANGLQPGGRVCGGGRGGRDG